ncbi:methyltransferase domain-containing protein [Methanospirillum sp.]
MDIEKFQNIVVEKRSHCVICGKKVDASIIEFPDFPMTEIYSDELVKEKTGVVDQRFHFCTQCGHGQIANVIDVELQYGGASFYYYRTSESARGRESADFFINFVNSIVKDRHFKNIIELGCNDLYVLKSLQSRADKLIGIDPILIGRENEFSENNIIAIGDFFENVTLDEEIDMVISLDTLEHVSNPKEFVKKIVDKASNETIFFFQFPLLETLLDACRFDHIFHQHLNYFSLKSILYLLNDLGCELIDYKINSNHWGAILISFKKGKNGAKYLKNIWEITVPEILERYSVFKCSMDAASKRLSYIRGDKKIYGYGAALMLPVLSYHLGNDLSCLECVIDDDKRKEGLYYINLPVKIQTRENILDIGDSIILITAIASMNNVRQILSKLIPLNPKQIILPLNLI